MHTHEAMYIHDLLWLRQHEVMDAAGVSGFGGLGIDEMSKVLIHVLGQKRHKRSLHSSINSAVIAYTHKHQHEHEQTKKPSEGR